MSMSGHMLGGGMGMGMGSGSGSSSRPFEHKCGNCVKDKQGVSTTFGDIIDALRDINFFSVCLVLIPRFFTVRL